MPDPIVIVDYDPEWPLVFARLRDRERAAMAELPHRIEHIGSTSVTQLAAKPIIDLVVIVSPTDVSEAIARLVSIGYEHQGSLGVEGRDAFKGLTDDPPHHLYLSPTDSEDLRAQLTFRDRLRADPELAARYATLKRSLATRFRNDRLG
ncbi:MAG TPA: GrpB family protein [Propionibacteriaceae bacterium]